MHTTAIHNYLEKHHFRAFTPKAVLFDMDGVLYDSMPNHATAWHDSMAHYGIRMAPEEAYTFEGMRGVETIKIVARRQWGRTISDEEAREMYDYKSTMYAGSPVASLIPGAHDIMAALHNRGLKTGVVTGSAQATLLDRLNTDYQGLLTPGIFVTALNIEHGKPAPDPYLKGMEMAGTEPWETIVVENAPLGVRAAVAARCFTVAVNTGPLPDQDLLREGCDLLFHSMHDFLLAVNEQPMP